MLVDPADRSLATERESGSRGAWWTVAWVAVAVGVVLRVWGVGGQDLTFDESFTATASRRPVGDLLSFLRTSDTHPPLDYLLRIPFASTGNELLVRAPSVVCSIGTLALLAWWMRSRGTFGAFTVIAAAFMPFMVGHGREARMYAVVMLLGLVAAMAAERWLQRPTHGVAVVVSVAGFLALMSHSAAIVPVGTLLLLPGLRRDRCAWQYRAWLIGAFVAWGVVWGLSFREQAGVVSAFWIPLTSASWLQTAGAALVTARKALVPVSFLVLILAVGALLIRREAVSKVAVLTLVVPFVVVAVVGLELHLLLPRSFAFGAWAVAAALGAGVDWMRSNLGHRGGLVGVALMVVLLAPPSIHMATYSSEELAEMDELERRIQPGDRISIHPAWFGPLLEWRFVAGGRFEAVAVGGDDRFDIVDPTAPPSGRVHLMDHREVPIGEAASRGLRECTEPLVGSSWLLRCVEDPASGR